VDIFSDGRNFYVDQVGSDVYLYIVACPLNGDGTQAVYSDNNALRLTAVNGSVTISLSYSNSLMSLANKPEYKYRRNGVGEWVVIDWQNDTIELNASEYIQVKLSNNFTDFSIQKFMRFVFGGNGSVKASGDIRSMLGTSDKQMYSYCYLRMFYNCTSLIKAPQLPANKLETYCYYGMFYGCTGLVTAPSLPATKLANYCYSTMFYNCTSLIKAPQLPANKLETGCYYGMFENCSSLIKAPVINANLLSSTSSSSCFREMFFGCSSLTKAPRIRLGMIPHNGCAQMFYGCTNLSEICIDATSINDNDSLYNWLVGISSSGTFYCKDATIFDTNSSSGIPTGWAIKSTDDYYEEDIHGDEYRRGVMITSGYNSSDNGRGNITSSDTVGNMEQSFDENKTHQMGTYNSDGSLNQEIWGYKSFNSPVQFRNGIYDEFVSQIAYVTHTSDNEYSVAGSSIKLNSKDPNTDKTSKLILGTVENIDVEYNCYNGTGTCIVSGDCDNISPGISPYASNSSTIYSTVGTFCGEYIGYTGNSSECTYDACRCEMTSTYKDVCYSTIESKTLYTDTVGNSHSTNKITLIEKNVQGGDSSICMASIPHQENHYIELKTTNLLEENDLKTSKITLSSNNTHNYSYIDVSADKLRLTGDLRVNDIIYISSVSDVFNANHLVSPMADADRNGLNELASASSVTVLRNYSEEREHEPHIIKHLIIKTTNYVHCLLNRKSFQDNYSSYASFNTTNDNVSNAIPVYWRDPNDAEIKYYGCIFTDQYNKLIGSVCRKSGDNNNYTIQWISRSGSHDNYIIINNEDFRIYMSSYGKVIFSLKDNSSSPAKLCFYLCEFPNPSIGRIYISGTTGVIRVGEELASFSVEYTLSEEDITISQPDSNNIYVHFSLSSSNDLHFYCDDGSWLCKKKALKFTNSTFTLHTHDKSRYTSIIKRSYNGAITQYVVVARVKNGLYHVESPSNYLYEEQLNSILDINDGYGSIEDYFE
jgi:hypothetical protein